MCLAKTQLIGAASKQAVGLDKGSDQHGHPDNCLLRNCSNNMARDEHNMEHKIVHIFLSISFDIHVYFWCSNERSH